MKNVEQKMLKDLYESVNGLYAYTFYSRYSIEPEDMVSFISKYKEKKIINHENDKLSLTAEGKNIILKQIYYHKTGKGKSSGIPQEFLSEKLEINLPYLPNVKTVSAEILNIKKVE